MPQIRESRPTGQDGAASTNLNDGSESSPLMPGLHRTEPLTAEDRIDIDILVAAAERGFRMAVRCTRCGQWLVAKSSVHAHMGPVCRAKTGGTNA